MIAIYSKKIVNWLIHHSGLSTDEDQIDIYVYGLECFLNTAITVFILLIWGFFTHTILETLCWIGAFSILRHHTGGFHAPTQFTCIISSSLLGMSNWIVLQYVNINIIHIFTLSIGCMIICLLFAPMNSRKSELSTLQQCQEKGISILLIGIGALVSYLLPCRISISIMYAFFCTCILMLLKKVSDKLIPS